MALSPEEAHAHKLESQRRWVAAHPEYERNWKRAHPEKVREQARRRRLKRAAYRDAHREEYRQKKREYNERKRIRAQAAEAAKQRDRDRARAWAQAHPDETRARKQAWAAANPDKRRQQALAYYYRHHEERKYVNRARTAERRTSPAARAEDFLYHETEKERYQAHARAYRADPVKRAAHNAYQNEWRKRERRRLQLGLPRIAGHRAIINERIDNDAAAAAFFTRPRSRAEKRTLWGELTDTFVHAYVARARAESLAPFAARLLWEMQRPARVDQFLRSRAGRRLREEVKMDVVARLMQSKPAYPDLEAELRRRALELVRERELDRPGPLVVGRGRTVMSTDVAGVSSRSPELTM